VDLEFVKIKELINAVSKYNTSNTILQKEA
jgi:hypothetical protein